MVARPHLRYRRINRWIEPHSGPACPNRFKAENRLLEELKVLQTVTRTVPEIKTGLGGKYWLDLHQLGKKDGYKCSTQLVCGELTYI
ncbi:hypothetical protein AVEN_188381-1 [Araneus ventricosus]|uniref:Uncharacterized protein n=1 Tax=Araneus ventricosus TaxID=182803 RepID=A0A4Y2EA34_ARAVE|nr:hypothetical protein AVEN_188381-1 [Araneus ventricosus]